SISDASSASAFELLTRFDTGQRRTRNPKERDLDHISLLLRGIEWCRRKGVPPEPRVSIRHLPKDSPTLLPNALSNNHASCFLRRMAECHVGGRVRQGDLRRPRRGRPAICHQSKPDYAASSYLRF